MISCHDVDSGDGESAGRPARHTGNRSVILLPKARNHGKLEGGHNVPDSMIHQRRGVNETSLSSDLIKPELLFRTSRCSSGNVCCLFVFQMRRRSRVAVWRGLRGGRPQCLQKVTWRRTVSHVVCLHFVPGYSDAQ